MKQADWPNGGTWQIVKLPVGATLDVRLAEGWEFVGPLLHRGLYGHIDGRTVGLAPLRQPVQAVGLSRNQRKLLYRNRRRFRVEITPIGDLTEREALYAAHKPRFLGPAFATLADFVGRYRSRVTPDCREVAIYDGDRRVAVSYVLLGERAAYSLLALFDQDYGRYSLGTQTMLEEIELLRAAGGEHYYPGHILVGHEGLAYKLRLRGLEYLDWRHGWQPMPAWDAAEHPVRLLDAQLDALGAELDAADVPWTRCAYGLFGLPGLIESPVPLLGMPEYLDLGPVVFNATEWRLIVSPNVFQGWYELAVVRAAPPEVWADRLADFGTKPLQVRPAAPPVDSAAKVVALARSVVARD